MEIKDSGARRHFDTICSKYGRLAILKILPERNSGHIMAACLCDCGNEVTVSLSSLRAGRTKSCGCYRKEVTYNTWSTHGLCKTRLYSIWTDIKRRCYNSANKRYNCYGGRGISVCDEWLNDFPAFYDWANQSGYAAGLTIDRIDVNGNYEPANCRWATWKQQANNTTRNHMLTYKGETLTLSQWEERTGLNRDLLKDRINKLHWSDERALTTPVREDKRHGRT
jgi:hypothetical protein